MHLGFLNTVLPYDPNGTYGERKILDEQLELPRPLQCFGPIDLLQLWTRGNTTIPWLLEGHCP